ncbi:MAG: SDR family NAD(P)-dependent oxidoreductase [Chitinophagales bacterium]|nr:SDR family NAD(P)-dependent oxidoreductase [Chitinophagales bacterium]
MEKQILITGAGGGIGRSIAEELWNRGYRIIATDIQEELSTLQKVKVKTVKMDVTRVSQIQDLSNKMKQAGDKIHGIVYSAGVFDMFPFVECDDSRLHNILNVNALGLQRVIQIFLPLLAPSSKIVVISSESVDLLSPFGLYAYSKYCLEGLCNVIRQELKLLGHDLIIIRPGAHQTSLFEDSKNPVNGSENSIFKKYLDLIPELTNELAPDPSDPKDIAVKVRQIFETADPANIYKVNIDKKLRWFGKLPDRWKEKLFRKMLNKKLKE